MSDLVDRSSVPFASASSPSGTNLGDHWLVDLSDVVVAHSLIVLVGVDTLQPIGHATLRALDALGHSCAQLVIYSREPSVDAIRLRVELPRASWLYPSSVIRPSDIIALLRRGTADARVLAIGICPELLRSLEPSDAVLSRAGDTDDASHDASVLRSMLWAIVKLRYRIRGTTAQ